MIIARLLTPPEIGVYSLTMVLVTFVATFRDLGAGQYLVQKKDLAMLDVRNTWAVQLGLGLAFCLLIAIASVPVSRFYREPRMLDIMLVLAVNFALTPFQALPYAWLTRAMRFDVLALMRMTAALVQGLTGIGLAWTGFGPISLAWANLAASVAGVTIALAIVGRELPWKPHLAGVRRVVAFGGRITGTTLLNTVRNASPELFLGKLQGMTETGLFSRGQGLVAMFERLVMDAVNAVALPLFAREMREGREITTTFLRAAALITALGWSFLAFVGILAFPVVRLLYGAQWDDAVDPTRWLAAAMALAVPVHICLAPMVATGAIAHVLRVALVSTCVAVGCSALGAYAGLMELSQLLVLAAAISSALWLRAAREHMRFTWAALGRTFAKSAVVAAFSAAAPLVLAIAFGWRSNQVALTLLLAIPGSAAGFCVAAYATRHAVWKELASATSHLVSVIRRR
jgi:O-antigen/teichoic acid export membrane protein